MHIEHKQENILVTDQYWFYLSQAEMVEALKDYIIKKDFEYKKIIENLSDEFVNKIDPLNFTPTAVFVLTGKNIIQRIKGFRPQ